MRTQPPYGLADLHPDNIGELNAPFERFAPNISVVEPDPTVDRFAIGPTSLARIGPSWLPSFGNAIDHSPELVGIVEPYPRPDVSDGRVQTAFLNGGGTIGDAARSGPSLGFKVSDDDFEPIRPGQPIKRKSIDERQPGHGSERQPLQIDLPRFDPPQGVQDRMISLINKPGLRDQMKVMVGAGRTMMGDANWFDTAFLRDRFVKRQGPELGMRNYLKLIDTIAVLSPGSDVGTNIRNASYWFNRWRRGEPLPNTGSNVPYPYGHRMMALHLALLGMIAMQGALDPIRYPKITSYAENLKGNERPVTLDIHSLRLPAMLARAADFLKKKYRDKLEAGELSMTEALARPAYWRGPYPNEVGALEQFYKELLPDILTPAETQSGAWVGGGHITGVRSNGLWTFEQQFNDRIRRTAEKEGLTEDEVWDRFIDGKLDLVLADGQNPVV